MAAVDDAATVLDQFCHDVANLPAEIAHLLEEIQAKDQQIQTCRDVIQQRDNALQKWIRQNGSVVKNPKEEAFTKTVLANFRRAEILQAEKVGLSEKAMVILDRQIKRFDIKLRDLQATDQFPSDPSLPSLLQPSAANAAPPASVSGLSTPLSAAQSGGAPNIANAAMARLQASANPRTHSPLAAQNPMLNQPHLNGSASRSSREASADASKRRRLNASIALPATSSSLRQSSIGPGTPKAGTPLPTSSRAGSAQPSRPAAATKKAPANSKKLAPHQASAAAAARKRVRPSTGGTHRKGDRASQVKRSERRGRGSPSASPTPSSSRASTSPTPSSLPHGHDGTAEARSRRRGQATSDEEMEDAEADAEAEEDDTQVYCTCQRVSFGDMVACDNEDCPYQWFHWGCVGLKEEPKGEWLCPNCRELPKDKIVKA